DLLAVCREVRQELADLVRERHFSCLDELQDRRGGELFGDGADAENHVRLDRNGELDVGQAVPFAQKGSSVLNDDDGCAGTRRRIGLREDAIEPCTEIGVRLQTSKRWRGRDQSKKQNREAALSNAGHHVSSVRLKSPSPRRRNGLPSS